MNFMPTMGDWLMRLTCKLFGHNYHYWVDIENPIGGFDAPEYARLTCLRCNEKWIGKEVYRHLVGKDNAGS